MDGLCNDAVGCEVQKMSYIDQSLPMALKVQVWLLHWIDRKQSSSATHTLICEGMVDSDLR